MIAIIITGLLSFGFGLAIGACIYYLKKEEWRKVALYNMEQLDILNTKFGEIEGQVKAYISLLNK